MLPVAQLPLSYPGPDSTLRNSANVANLEERIGAHSVTGEIGQVSTTIPVIMKGEGRNLESKRYRRTEPLIDHRH